jgi:GNAT superfamily N-acetyltransferase
MGRQARAGDEVALAELRWRWRSEERKAVMGHDEFVSAFVAWIATHRDTHLAWLAEMDGEAAGMAWLAALERIPGPDAWERRSGSLQSVYVVPEHRNSGLGAALVTAALQRSRGLGMAYVVVHPTERSVPLYHRAGFAPHPAAMEDRNL